MAKLLGPKPRLSPDPPADDAASRPKAARFFKPKYKILGCDLAGRVAAVGTKVEKFGLGDEVFGMCAFGAFAEYCVAEVSGLALKPASLTFEEAAALPQATFIALEGIRDKGKVQAGQKVLINGAGGGAGTLAVQFAKSLGAEVTGVDNTRKLEMMRSIGADHVVDSTFQAMLLGPLMSMFRSQTVTFLMAGSNPEDLVQITQLIEAGKVTPVIDRCFSLGEVSQALQHMGEGHALGKVVIVM